MKIILKYKKTFMVVVIISFIIAILPVVGISVYMNIGKSSITETEFKTEVQNTSYEPFELSVPSDVKLELPNFEHFNRDKTTIQKTFSLPESVQEIMYQAYLEKGMTIKVSYNAKISNGNLNFIILDKNGEKYTFSGTSDSPSFTIYESGNYGVAYQANEAKGSFTVDIMVTNIE